jgi:hypothetical protein
MGARATLVQAPPGEPVGPSVATIGENLAGFYSLIATCEANQVNPVDYLADVLLRVHRILRRGWTNSCRTTGRRHNTSRQPDAGGAPRTEVHTQLRRGARRRARDSLLA